MTSDDPEFPASNEIRIGAEVGRRKTDALPDSPPQWCGYDVAGGRSVNHLSAGGEAAAACTGAGLLAR